MLSPLQAREAVHVLLLERLLSVRDGDAITVKGGVSLRLFHGSPRYSEDIDLDGDPEARGAIRRAVTGFFEDSEVARYLKRLRLRGLDPKEGPNKDTSTTFRHKFHVIGTGEVGYPTRVEVSFREPHPADRRKVGEPDPDLVERYLNGGAAMRVPHYAGSAAVRQKVEALHGRREVQARDVFDLALLIRDLDRDDPGLLAFLAENLGGRKLDEAYRRIFELGYADFESQVVEFLGREAQKKYRDPEAWEKCALQVGYLIDDVRDRQGRDRE